MKRNKLLFFSLQAMFLLCTAVHAEIIDAGELGDDIYWELSDDGTLEIIGTGDMYDWDDNLSTTPLRGMDIKNVKISDGVTSIGEWTFYGCTDLASVIIPNSVTNIGTGAFADCMSLTSITIPNSVTSIEDETFCNCENLISVSIPNYVTKIGNEVFNGCASLTSINIPNSVTSIGDGTFNGCLNMEEIRCYAVNPPELSGSVFDNTKQPTCTLYVPAASIDAYKAVAQWNNFGHILSIGTTPEAESNKFKTDNAIILGKTTASITETDLDAINKALDDYDKLSEAAKDILSAEKSLLENLKTEAEKLKSGLIERGFCGDNVTYALYDDGTLVISGSGKMKEYDIHETKAPWYRNNNIIKKVQIQDGVTSIGDDAFYDCSDLTSVTIPSSVTNIGSGAFSGCSGLISVTIPNSVTSIGSSAFSGCSGLTSVTIPNSIKSIDYRAFYGCSGLTSVTIPNSVVSIGSDAFYGCSGLTSIAIPNFVTSIGSSAFKGCNGLTLVTIPNSVKSIGDNAFWGCSGLTSIAIPNNVKSIGTHTFYDCSGLTSVTIPNSVINIGSSAFNRCNRLTSVTIPNSVKSIGSSAFQGCSGLTSIEISSSIESIGYSAFESCTKLKTVYCYSEDIPTTSGTDIFNKVNVGNVTLYVPATSMDAYEAAEPWKNFGHILSLGTTAEIEANKYKTVNATILGKNTSIVKPADLEAINKALNDYSMLSDAAKELLNDEKELLDALKAKAEIIKKYDLNGDNKVTIADVTEIIDIIVNQ